MTIAGFPSGVESSQLWLSLTRKLSARLVHRHPYLYAVCCFLREQLGDRERVLAQEFERHGDGGGRWSAEGPSSDRERSRRDAHFTSTSPSRRTSVVSTPTTSASDKTACFGVNITLPERGDDARLRRGDGPGSGTRGDIKGTPPCMSLRARPPGSEAPTASACCARTHNQLICC